jgi:hypothetical protein
MTFDSAILIQLFSAKECFLVALVLKMNTYGSLTTFVTVDVLSPEVPSDSLQMLKEIQQGTAGVKGGMVMTLLSLDDAIAANDKKRKEKIKRRRSLSLPQLQTMHRNKQSNSVDSSTPRNDLDFEEEDMLFPSNSTLQKTGVKILSQVSDAIRDDQIRNQLKRYAIASYSEEGVLFWEAVNLKFKTRKTKLSRIKQAKKIVKEFLQDGAAHEINTSMSKKVVIIDRIQRGDVSDNLFDSIEFELKEEGGVLQDTFRRYKSVYGNMQF